MSREIVKTMKVRLRIIVINRFLQSLLLCMSLFPVLTWISHEPCFSAELKQGDNERWNYRHIHASNLLQGSCTYILYRIWSYVGPALQIKHRNDRRRYRSLPALEWIHSLESKRIRNISNLSINKRGENIGTINWEKKDRMNRIIPQKYEGKGGKINGNL